MSEGEQNRAVLWAIVEAVERLRVAAYESAPTKSPTQETPPTWRVIADDRIVAEGCSAWEASRIADRWRRFATSAIVEEE